MKIGIIDIGIGNLASIQNMFARLGYTTEFVRQSSVLATCDKIVLPGMGYFDKCMVSLNDSGLRNELELQVLQNKKPFLGICVGLQMLMRSSEEGLQSGLNWIEGETIRFDNTRMTANHKIPNMGWLDVTFSHATQMDSHLEEARFYFAHSYHVVLDKQQDEWLTSNYGYPFTSAVQRNNIFGVQFHPEKSHRFGKQLLKNFAEIAL